MDAAPRSFDELPIDPTYGVPVPFAAGTEVGATVRDLDKRRVTQCALSRVCGVCGACIPSRRNIRGSKRTFTLPLVGRVDPRSGSGWGSS